MNNTQSRKNKRKGSVLVAVVGVLAVLSAMALRFNFEMETAMIKTASKSLSTDVKTAAISGREYLISEILANGKGFDDSTFSAAHDQLSIEEDMEVQKSTTPSKDILGFGISSVAMLFSSDLFYGGRSSTIATNYVPEAVSLYPSDLNFLVEDLSGKLPIGHVSQFYQRHLISTILVKLMTGSVPEKVNDDINTELFNVTEATTFNRYDSYGSKDIFLRSLVPYRVLALGGGASHRNYAGLPLADGIITGEELGTSYTWLKGSNAANDKKITNDLARSAIDYRKLEGSLTPYSRFMYDKNFTNVTYAMINPLVLGRQNFNLYKSFFYYNKNDRRLKMQYSVSLAPDSADTTTGATDDESNPSDLKIGLANPNTFESGDFHDYLKDSIVEGMPGNSGDVVTSLRYNARDRSDDLHPVISSLTLSPLPSDQTKRVWSDPEFSSADAKKVYYDCMEKAIQRFSRACKPIPGYERPGDDFMSNIVTRKTLELAIIKSVFGDAILFTGKDGSNTTLIDTTKLDSVLDKTLIYKNIDDIHLENVIFVENAFSKFGETTMEGKYFVPYWNKYDAYTHNTKYTSYSGPDIFVPGLGLYEKSGQYYNFLPHPQTNQKKLNEYYVNVAIAYSKDATGLLPHDATVKDIPCLYKDDVETAKGYLAQYKPSSGPQGDAFLDLDTQSLASPQPSPMPAKGYIEMLDVNASHIAYTAADFSPYETKIRMAVLVNLLNAIIPAKISKTENFATSYDKTLFSESLVGGVAKNLKEFIYFDSGTNEYKVNTHPDTGLPAYMKGWDGGIKSPGMTFWKFGVNSTTFQFTVDAFKYEDATRLTSVVTFDLGNLSNTDAKYKLDDSDKTSGNSFIFLNPLGRAFTDADKFVIGNGSLRYPTPDTKGWRIINSVWSDPFNRSTVLDDDKFNMLFFPDSKVNVGIDGDVWHYEQHAAETAAGKPFTRFRVDVDGKSSYTRGADYSTGSVLNRYGICGKGSWLKFYFRLPHKVPAGTMNFVLFRSSIGSNGYGSMEHQIELVYRKTGATKFSSPKFGNSTAISKGKISVELDKGEYDLYLRVNRDITYPGEYMAEILKYIQLYEDF